MATYAIGDVQGCFDELCRLLEVIDFKPERDQLWFVGDLVNRGPKSLETLRFVKSLGNSAKTVLGNHDLHLLAVAHGSQPASLETSLKSVLEAIDRNELIMWLKTQPLVYYDAHLRYALVHAGLPPQWGLDEALEEANAASRALQGPRCADFLKRMYGNIPSRWQPALSPTKRLRYTINALTRMRFCDLDGRLKLKATVAVNWENNKTKLVPWFKHPGRKSKGLPIVFGHWAALGGTTFEPDVYALDTGCVWGGFLTAMRLHDNVRFSVPTLACHRWR